MSALHGFQALLAPFAPWIAAAALSVLGALGVAVMRLRVKDGPR